MPVPVAPVELCPTSNAVTLECPGRSSPLSLATEHPNVRRVRAHLARLHAHRCDDDDDDDDDGDVRSTRTAEEQEESKSDGKREWDFVKLASLFPFPLAVCTDDSGVFHTTCSEELWRFLEALVVDDLTGVAGSSSSSSSSSSDGSTTTSRATQAQAFTTLFARRSAAKKGGKGDEGTLGRAFLNAGAALCLSGLRYTFCRDARALAAARSAAKKRIAKAEEDFADLWM